MRLLINEDQIKKYHPKIKCEKCHHSWDLNVMDLDPFLCHKCGFDIHLDCYRPQEFIDFWLKNQQIKN